VPDRALREQGPWANGELRAMTAPALAAVLRQPPDHELMALCAQALGAAVIGSSTTINRPAVRTRRANPALLEALLSVDAEV